MTDTPTDDTPTEDPIVVTEPAPAPVKKPHRLGLFGPILCLALAFGGWSLYWFHTAGRIEKDIVTQQQGLIKAGYQVRFDPVHIAGYPYRMFAAFKNITIVSPQGRGFASPSLEAEANAYALDKWVVVAPNGLTLYRGHGTGVDLGQLSVTGRSLKASVSGLNKPIYNVALQGVGLKLVATDPAHPFAFDSAELFEAYLRPAVNAPATETDSADMLIRLNGAHGQPGSTVGDVSPDVPLSLHVEGTVSHMSAFTGKDFTESLNAWKFSEGQVSGFKGKLTAGDLNLFATSDKLSLDLRRHLEGQMTFELSGSVNPIGILGTLRLISKEDVALASPLITMALTTPGIQTKLGTQKFTLDFRDGSAYIGPIKLSDTPVLP
ncbi:MAG: DUF2125 domain-containing protein [Asticcacaulis sp.]